MIMFLVEEVNIKKSSFYNVFGYRSLLKWMKRHCAKLFVNLNAFDNYFLYIAKERNNVTFKISGTSFSNRYGKKFHTGVTLLFIIMLEHISCAKHFLYLFIWRWSSEPHGIFQLWYVGSSSAQDEPKPPVLGQGLCEIEATRVQTCFKHIRIQNCFIQYSKNSHNGTVI